MVVVETSSAEATVQLGLRLGRLLGPGDFVALFGELGAGKTQFAKGIAAGLAVDPATPVTSPTYTILNVYQGRLPLYHFDLYRLQGAEESAALGFEEYFYGKGVCVVEWSERLEDELPEEVISVTLAHLEHDSRRVAFEGSGPRTREIIEALRGSG
ncbi:tRNA (adenosine(37)-N6)-threonylcarbamoyltransferase complex ATPase subunit type 1 TsaE [Geomesophilobacter sediminis]|uniref:tRNA threonylcarbamoyladenosine biosynthesis protein TsaE n=1 Tax=Geomesophilobacter sediminis TaxID=2798584 RepID=A0A8J7JMU9_9BACT|nr:tRNA (adenosine(37)-N6)-threonylcarbamoyltransferase complex ATPase subunit type 1 TsaE [Geomesophilobacter sediminis]MBJ6726315.1 tRNA (adenosine(37)-N6)-threonylcarbamoyltransferase complex ATPase subunit type 1 TsaE [Geomesophilobacter sediminis]